MKVISIDGIGYVIEYSIEASLYNECTEKVAGLMADLSTAEDREDVKSVISSIADVPQTTLSMFYAGLLEHHGRDGDGTVLNKGDAKKLLRTYINEHKDDDQGNFYGVMNILIEAMVDDGFFKLIGLESMMTAEVEERPKKIPQDHKKKAPTKATVK